jgi:hypothetical protein
VSCHQFSFHMNWSTLCCSYGVLVRLHIETVSVLLETGGIKQHAGTPIMRALVGLQNAALQLG